MCAIHPYFLAAFPFPDRPKAEEFLERLIDSINDVYARRASIQPNHKTYNPVSVVQILRTQAAVWATREGLI